MPIKWYLHIVPGNIKEIKGTDLVVHLTGSALYDNNDNVTLFDIDLKNLVFNNISKESAGFNIIYDSENSLLFLNHGDSQNFLLSHLLTSSTGKRIVNQMTSQQYSIAGRFEDYEIDFSQELADNEFLTEIKLDVFLSKTSFKVGAFNAGFAGTTFSCEFVKELPCFCSKYSSYPHE